MIIGKNYIIGGGSLNLKNIVIWLRFRVRIRDFYGNEIDYGIIIGRIIYGLGLCNWM